MKEFTYTITDPNGLHARPAGILVKESGKYSSEITLHSCGKKGDAKKIFSVMGMGIKSGDSVTVKISGADEDNAVGALEVFFKNNL
ncbi:MAG: HPr family phosphocarrier protein [Eubacteriales bacterium]|nr:HPr family phosphocarrier protein [Eubacteriales bacterium]